MSSEQPTLAAPRPESPQGEVPPPSQTSRQEESLGLGLHLTGAGVRAGGASAVGPDSTGETNGDAAVGPDGKGETNSDDDKAP